MNPLSGQAKTLAEYVKNEGKAPQATSNLPTTVEELQARTKAWGDERGFNTNSGEQWHDNNHQFIGELYGENSEGLQKALGLEGKGPGAMEELLVNTFQEFVLNPKSITGLKSEELFSIKIDGFPIREAQGFFSSRADTEKEKEFFRGDTWEKEYVARVERMRSHPQFEQALQLSRQAKSAWDARLADRELKSNVESLRRDLLEMKPESRQSFLSAHPQSYIDRYRETHGDDLYGNGKEEYRDTPINPVATVRAITGDDDFGDDDLSALFGDL